MGDGHLLHRRRHRQDLHFLRCLGVVRRPRGAEGPEGRCGRCGAGGAGGASDLTEELVGSIAAPQGRGMDRPACARPTTGWRTRGRRRYTSPVLLTNDLTDRAGVPYFLWDEPLALDELRPGATREAGASDLMGDALLTARLGHYRSTDLCASSAMVAASSVCSAARPAATEPPIWDRPIARSLTKAGSRSRT